MDQITDWKESTNDKVKSIANSFVDSKFPRQQTAIQNIYTKMYTKPKTDNNRTSYHQIQINTTTQSFRYRDKLQLIGEMLEVAMTAYKGMLRLSSGVIKSKFDNHKQRMKIIQDMFSLGLIREVTDEEKIELAEHRLVQKSWGSPCYYGQRYNYNAHPSKSSVNKYIRMRLKRVYILTEKGRKLREILTTMKGLLLLVN